MNSRNIKKKRKANSKIKNYIVNTRDSCHTYLINIFYNQTMYVFQIIRPWRNKLYCSPWIKARMHNTHYLLTKTLKIIREVYSFTKNKYYNIFLLLYYFIFIKNVIDCKSGAGVTPVFHIRSYKDNECNFITIKRKEILCIT